MMGVVARRDKRVERAAWDADLVERGPFLKAIGSLPFDSTVPVRSTNVIDSTTDATEHQLGEGEGEGDGDDAEAAA